MSDCTCPAPNRPTGYEPEPLEPWTCLGCGGYACEYADPGKTRCHPAICDCFIESYPDSPRDLHPEAFIVHAPDCGWIDGPVCTCGADPERSQE